MKIANITKEQLDAAVEGSVSIAGVLRHLGVRSAGSYTYRALQDAADRLGVVLPRNGVALPNGTVRRLLSDEEFFGEACRRTGQDLKRRLIAAGRTYACEMETCELEGRTTWSGSEIVFQVDHINGNNLDNRVTNLRFLCPNCHSQTETFAGRNRRVSLRCSCGRAHEGKNCASQTILTTTCADCGALKAQGQRTPSHRCQACAIKFKLESGIGAGRQYPPVKEMLEGVAVHGYRGYAAQLGVSDNSVRRYLSRRGAI